MELFKLFGTIAINNKDANKAIDDTTGKAEKSESKMTSAFKKIGAAVATYFTVSKIKEFGTACIEAWDIQKQAEVKLETVMKQRMKATDSSVQSIKDLASAQQQLGVVGDEVQLSGAQQLATFLNTDSALKTLIPAMNNLAVQQNGVNVTTEAMTSIGNMMGKVMQGQTSALTRCGITMTDYQEQVMKSGTEEERAAMLAEIITDNVGNMNEVFAQTDAGKIQQAKNDFGDLQEQIGSKLEPVVADLYGWFDKLVQFFQKHLDPACETVAGWIDVLKEKYSEHLQPAVEKIKDAFDKVVQALSPIIEKIEEYVSSGKAAEDASTLLDTALDIIAGTIETVADAISGLVDFVEQIVQGFKDMKQWCSENKTALELLAVAAGTITGLIIAANAGTIALNTTMGIANGLLIAGSVAEGIMTAATTIWSGVCTVATGATTALGAAFTFLTSPIGIIILAIGAAIAVGILLYKNWDKIKEKLSELGQHIKDIWDKIKNTIVEKVEAIKEKIESGFNAIKEKVQNVFNAIKDFVSNVWNTIKNVISTVINAIKTVITNGMNLIKQTISNILNGIKSVFSSIWNGIKTAVSSVISGIKSVISNGLNGAKSVVSNVLGAIKDKFVSIFDSVKNVVKNAIDKIKGFFKFQWSLPKLKMPHPKISGKFSLNPPSVPKFSIDWYKKAMDNPYMFSSPTVFGSNPENGNLRAAGESGDEMMYGHSNLMEDIRNAVGEQNNAVVDTLNSWFERLLELFMEWFPEFKGQLVLDTGVLVAQTAPKMDKALGKLQTSRNRGR